MKVHQNLGLTNHQRGRTIGQISSIEEADRLQSSLKLLLSRPKASRLPDWTLALFRPCPALIPGSRGRNRFWPFQGFRSSDSVLGGRGGGMALERGVLAGVESVIEGSFIPNVETHTVCHSVPRHDSCLD